MKEFPSEPLWAHHPLSSNHSWKLTIAHRYPELGPRIVFISGGSGARELSRHLIRYTFRSSHILPVFDDGGSSRPIREHFQLPPPGDLRNRMMALADTSDGGHPAVQKLFNTRFSTTQSSTILHQEFQELLEGKHPLMQTMEKRFKQLIRSYLEIFYQKLPPTFDLRGGNLGNFILTGALLLHQNMETVLYLLQELVKVRGRILPIVEGNYFLRAILNDQSILDQQHQITSSPHLPIEEIRYLEPLSSSPSGFQEVVPTASSDALQAIRKADLLVYTMGSFFTSILPILGVKGIAEAIRKTSIPKIWIANPTLDYETQGKTFNDLVDIFYKTLQKQDIPHSQLHDYVQYVLCDTQNFLQDNRLPLDLCLLKEKGLQIFDQPYLDEQKKYSPERVVRTLFSVL